jgi:PAS domain S-box-containing protein
LKTPRVFATVKVLATAGEQLFPWLRGHLRRMGAPYLVLAISVVPTLLTYQRVRDAVEERDRARFHAEVKAMVDAIRERLRHYEEELRALKALYATGTPDAEAWRNYVVTIDLPRHFPGIRSLGYTERVAAAEKAAHEAKLRVIVPGYHITPPGEREIYFPTVYLNLFEELLRPEFGMDAYADPDLRAALEKARDTGNAAVSARVDVQTGPSTNHLPGFVIYTPIYRKDAPAGTVEERRAGVQGFVFGTFAVERLLLGIFGRREAPVLAIEVFDGETLSRATAMLAERNAFGPGGSTDANALTVTRPLVALDRTWTVRFTALPAFQVVSQSQLPLVVLLAGLTVNLLLFGITWSQAHAKFLAVQLSDDLRRLQERDRLLERATNDAIWDWHLESNQLAWNEAVQHMFGYAPLTIRPQIEWWKERLHPDDRRRILNGRDMAIQTGGEFWADEYRFRKGDGTFADVIDRGYIIHNNQGVPVRMIGSMVDVTGRKEAEEARLRSERKLALHVEQTPLAVIEWNLDFHVTEWNPAAERNFGYTDREAIGRHAFDLIVPEHVRATVKPLWDELLTPPSKGASAGAMHGTSRRSVNENLTKDGRLIICEWYHTPLIDKSGQIVGVASLALDVTATKRTEAALAAETERLAVTLRSIGEGVIVTDITGRVILLNKMAEHLTNRRQSDAMGQPLGDLFHILATKTRRPEDNPVTRVLEAEGVMELTNRTAVLVQEKAELTIAYSCSPVVNAANRVIGTVLVFRDITTEQRTTEELLKASKLESVGLLAGGLAHDFNNIMTAVIGNLSLAKLYCQPGDKVRQRIEEAERASLRTKDLTQQLLTFAKRAARP